MDWVISIAIERLNIQSMKRDISSFVYGYIKYKTIRNNYNY